MRHRRCNRRLAMKHLHVVLVIAVAVSACARVGSAPIARTAPEPRTRVLVSPPTIPEDERILEAVRVALEGDPAIDPQTTDVQVNDGVVELGGELPHPYLREVAVMRAERVRGVRAVIDRFEYVEAARDDDELRADVETALS